MPMSYHCPHCQALLQRPDDVSAHALRCESCGRVLPPIAQFASIKPAIAGTELVDGQEHRRPGQGIQRASFVAVGIVGGLVVVALLGATWLVLRSNLVVVEPEQPPLAQPGKKPANVLANPPVVVDPPPKAVAKKPGVPGMPQPKTAGPIAVVGNDRAIEIMLAKGQYQRSDRLDRNDPLDPMLRRFCKVFRIDLEADSIYVITAVSKQFGPHLRLERDPGKMLVGDDRRGGSANASLTFACDRPGQYRLIVSSYRGDVGDFTLSVRDPSLPLSLAPITLPQPDSVPHKFDGVHGMLGNLPVKILKLSPWTNQIAAAPDGKSFYVLQAGGMLRQIATHDLTDLKRVQLEAGCNSLAVSAAGLAVAHAVRGEVWVLDPATFEVKRRISAPEAVVIISAPATSWGYALQPRSASKRGMHVLDLANGTNGRRQLLSDFQSLAVADAQQAFTSGGTMQTDNGRVVSYRIQTDGALVREQTSPNVGGDNHVVSRDGKFVGISTPGTGDGPSMLHVFEARNLLQPAFVIKARPFDSFVSAFDTDARFVYVASFRSNLSVFDFEGRKRAEHNWRSGETLLAVVPLALRKIVLNDGRRTIVAELAEDGREAGAPKIDIRNVGDVVRIEDTVSAKDRLDGGRRYYKEYLFRLKAKTTYTIENNVRGRGGILELYDDNDMQLDYDNTMGRNGRIVFDCPRAGVYRVRVTSLDIAGGDSFVLTVREGTVAAPALPKVPM